MRYHRAAAIIAVLALSSTACSGETQDENVTQASNEAVDAAPPDPVAKLAAAEKRAGENEDALPEREAIETFEGVASFYGEAFQGRPTANGEIFDMRKLTAAHKDIELPSLARVTRVDTGESVIVRINDRGPFTPGRDIDLSEAAARELGFIDQGVAKVRVEVLGPAD